MSELNLLQWSLAQDIKR